MGKTKLDETFIFKICIKIYFLKIYLLMSKFCFFKVSVTVEAGRSLQQFTKNCLIRIKLYKKSTSRAQMVRICISESKARIKHNRKGKEQRQQQNKAAQEIKENVKKLTTKT